MPQEACPAGGDWRRRHAARRVNAVCREAAPGQIIDCMRTHLLSTGLHIDQHAQAVFQLLQIDTARLDQRVARHKLPRQGQLLHTASLHRSFDVQGHHVR